MTFLKKIKEKAKKLKREIVVLHLAYQHPETPWTAKALIILIIGYALSPIDLIPDFIPVIGLLDDFILLPIGIYWAIKLIPKKCIEGKQNQGRNLPMGQEEKSDCRLDYRDYLDCYSLFNHFKIF